MTPRACHNFRVKLASLILTVTAGLNGQRLGMRAKNFVSIVVFRVSFVVFRVSFVVFRVSFVVFRVSFVAFYRVSFVTTPCFNRGQAVVKGLKRVLKNFAVRRVREG